ncbi:MAG: hypothetical protein GYB68_18100 [Chloroflexi bacterium]|nr:hypothetical protein [Chloroflexota bacterium]
MADNIPNPTPQDDEPGDSILPLVIIIGIMALLFALPFVLLLGDLIINGGYTFPQVTVDQVRSEVNPSTFLAILLALIPIALVILVDRARRAERITQKQSVLMTLVGVALLMVVLTVVPLISFSGVLATLPTSGVGLILVVIALPLFVVIATVVLVWARITVRGDVPPGDLDLNTSQDP